MKIKGLLPLIALSTGIGIVWASITWIVNIPFQVSFPISILLGLLVGFVWTMLYDE